MTSITFYSHVTSRLNVARKICAKAMINKIMVSVITKTENEAHNLSNLLWSTPANSFMPNCFGNNPNLKKTPIMIDNDPQRIRKVGILINLTNEIPKYFSTFERLVEIVDGREEVRKPARQRFIFYKNRGYSVDSHSLNQ